ncbi:NAD(P)-dependent oxidoreductase [Streptomyces sp. NPDC051064]|uniref:NAD(P)-dependent oxidoreductase n=1 Tax=Streptomyces sp. NPDC051064 TaxID=3365641 RepID=UPI0037932A7A
MDWAAASEAPPRHEIHGSDIGVIGASRTGRAYIRMVRAMGARVRVTDPYLSDADARELGVESVPLETLLTGSPIVAVHAPVTEETHRMLGAEQLALMPDGAGLVNTARAWLVDQDALLAELTTGRLDAALDVFDAEPLPIGHPFRSLPNVLLTPHQAAGSVECRQRLGASAVNEVLRLLAARPPVHAVTADALVRLR